MYIPVYASLVRSYVDAIRSGTIPCVQSALGSMATIENEKAVEVSVAVYVDMMKDVVLPTPDEQTLLDAHTHAKEKSFEKFAQVSVMDDRGVYKEKSDVSVHLD